MKALLYCKNGLVVAKCEINKIEKIKFYESEYADDCTVISQYYTDTIENIENESCLTFDQLYEYLECDECYALHLENIKALDNPLSFTKNYIYKNTKGMELITQAPQNMCYCYDRFGNKYVLISIRPEHLVNILNGKKTIEVRKKILKEMKALVK